MKTIDDLIDILTLKKEDSKTYTGTSKTIGNSRVFGGQVLAQALTRSLSNHP
jgi:acyl-CoA thioesterase